MNPGRPSATAEGAALLRAAHRVLDDPRILDDPLAIRLLDGVSADDLRAQRAGFEQTAVRRLRTSVVVRARYTEDLLRAAVERGLRRYVILGAGLDSFAYRSDLLERGLRVFEVDHPDTQADKRARLEAAGIAIPSGVTFVPVDFERQTLRDAFVAAGIDATEPTFVSWLGVTAYLERDSVAATLAELARLAPGSEVVLSYNAPPTDAADATREEVAALRERLAALGEPWRTFFSPDEMRALVKSLGFVLVEQVGPDDAIARYWAGGSGGSCPSPTSWLLHAAVPAR